MGSTLLADHDYVQHCYNILFEIGFKLSQVVWRKINIGLDSCDEVLCDITYDLIKNRQYELASNLLEFSTSKPMKHIDKKTELVLWKALVNAHEQASRAHPPRALRD